MSQPFCACSPRPQHTTNFFNRLAPAYDSMFHSVLLPSTRAAVLKAVDTLRGQAERSAAAEDEAQQGRGKSSWWGFWHGIF